MEQASQDVALARQPLIVGAMPSGASGLGTAAVTVDQLPGLTPPPPPSSSAVFKVVFYKNLFLAWKRWRVPGALFPVLLQVTISVIIYHVFANIDPPDVGRLLVAAIVPINIMYGIQQSFQGAYLDIIGEKESKMKITQNVYGLTTAMYWLTWGAYFSVVSCVCIVAIHILLTFAAPILIHVNFLMSFVVLALSFMQQFLMVCVLCVFFDSAKPASMFNSFLNFLLVAGSAGLQAALAGRSKIVFYLAGLIPVVNVFNTLSSMLWLISGRRCDQNGECVTTEASLANLFTDEVCLVDYDPISTGCEFSRKFFAVGPSMLMMFIATIVLAFLAWWLDNVWQGEYGAAKPKLFCLQSKYMCPRRRATTAVAGSHAALSICGLRKEFVGGKVAVDDMSLETCWGEIFALLGHNGAGKTTAINCIVGLIPPTAGEATVNGCDARTDIEGARRQMAICPQDSPMYDEFTVRRHLVFFSGLRGVPQARVAGRIVSVLTALGLTEKIDELCKTLSGGQKRRLWVATALIGESPVCFLDEPTSGMDPSARRELWDLLLRMKDTGRCVIFTTHYLDEADILADRKAVLARGRIQAVGTSRDLKMQFGIGYHLRVEFKHGAPMGSGDRLAGIVTRHIVTALKEHDTDEQRMQAQHAANHVSFTLPYAEVPNFGSLLTALESERGALQLEDYTMGMTTLDEVFLELGRQAEQEAASDGDGQVINVDFQPVIVDEAARPEQIRPEASEWRSAKALYVARLKPLQNSRRKRLYMSFLPAFFVFISFGISMSGGSNRTAAGSNSYAFVIYPALGFALPLITMCMDVILDRTDKCKIVSLSQGLTPRAYWAGTAMAHYTIMIPTTVVFAVMLFVLRPDSIGTGSIPMVILTVVLYPINLLLFAYSISQSFDTPEIAMKILPLINMLGATIPPMIVWVFVNPLIGLESPFTEIGFAIHVALSCVLPSYTLPGMLVYLVTEYAFLDLSLADSLTSFAAVPLCLFPVASAIYSGALVRLDSRSYSSRPGDYRRHPDGRKDADVKAEEQRCIEQDGRDEAVRYQGLSHTYRTKVGREWKETHAVRGVSLGVQKGECFGLLGPNGAGKTTTLAILTGEVRPPTRGCVSIFGHDMSQRAGLAQAYGVLGLCPQVDPLWKDLSGRDHLMYYGRLKGAPETTLEQTVDILLRRLGLDPIDADKPADKYSGGMKRKLSLGIALIGHSPMLFLDEPSAAVDAAAKRHLWKVIKLRGPDQTVVLTTHSMEEAEALCDRIAIQVRGQLRCLGTPMHIKGKYGSGYQLEILVKSSMQVNGSSSCRSNTDAGCFGQAQASGPSEDIVRFVCEKITVDAQLLESHAERYLFQLPPTGTRSGLSLGHVFTELQHNMQALGIADYSITQPSLEQVFLRFAREQIDGRDEVGPEEIPSLSIDGSRRRAVIGSLGG